MAQKCRELKEKGGQSTIIFGDFNIPLLTTDRQSLEIEELNINQIDIIDLYRTLYSQQQNSHFFQEPMEYSFTKIDCMLNHKTILNTFKRTEFMANILFDNSRTKLEINNKIIILEYLKIKQHTSK